MATRRYNTAERANRRELLIKRHDKDFVVYENMTELFRDSDFNKAVAFLNGELAKSPIKKVS